MVSERPPLATVASLHLLSERYSRALSLWRLRRVRSSSSSELGWLGKWSSFPEAPFIARGYLHDWIVHRKRAVKIVILKLAKCCCNRCWRERIAAFCDKKRCLLEVKGNKRQLSPGSRCCFSWRFLWKSCWGNVFVLACSLPILRNQSSLHSPRQDRLAWS